MVRVQVLRKVHSSYRPDYSYRVVQRDTDKLGLDSVLEIWEKEDTWDTRKKFTGEWSGGPEASRYVYFTSKVDAVQKARQLAPDFQGKFVPKLDFIENQDDILIGPMQDCLLCGCEVNHSFEAMVCPRCKIQWQRGKMAEEDPDTEYITFNPSYLAGINYYYGEKEEIDLQAVFSQVFNVPVERWAFRKMQNTHIFLPKDSKDTQSPHSGWKAMKLNARQVETFRSLVAFLEAVRKEAYNRGYVSGRSLLNKLANGELTVEKTNEQQTRDLARGI